MNFLGLHQHYAMKFFILQMSFLTKKALAMFQGIQRFHCQHRTDFTGTMDRNRKWLIPRPEEWYPWGVSSIGDLDSWHNRATHWALCEIQLQHLVGWRLRLALPGGLQHRSCGRWWLLNNKKLVCLHRAWEGNGYPCRCRRAQKSTNRLSKQIMRATLGLKGLKYSPTSH